MMRATEFEFRQRFLCIGIWYAAGFACYNFDHECAGVALANFIWGRHFSPDLAVMTGSVAPLHVIFGVAALLCILCGVIRTWAAAYLRSNVVHDHALHSENLVADGPFRWTRNPLYLGGVLLGAGVGFLASRVGWFVMTFGLLFFYYRLIGREEAALTASQGESFRAYCAAVPRFFPALRARVPSSGAKPRWGQAFAGEMFMWGFAAAVVVFAVTLNIVLCWIVSGASFAGYLCYWLISGRIAQKKSTAVG